jgi:pimeloyl-ACP methyl ester carboxylesterase
MAATRKRVTAAGDDSRPTAGGYDGGQPSLREVFYSSPDGLALFARDYGDPLSPWLPVVCLPGLTRSSRDFHQLATYLTQHRHRPRRVVAFDYRGRGRSQWDADPGKYNPLTELADILSGMTALGLGRAIVVGTSRGGILGMLMGLSRPATVSALVLNDVGPVLEARGLARIKSYVGRTPSPDDWNDAAQIQRRLHGGQFTAWGKADWDYFARLTYREDGERPVPDCDPALSATLDGIELDLPIPTMWDEFRALKEIPILSIRGANSDMLSTETVQRMVSEHPRVETVTVANEGHAPLFRRSSLLARVSAFITSREGPLPSPEAVLPRVPPAFNLDAPRD